ncbi:MAG: OmpP1/FadL family transporter [Gammaproteobacteria bacterium]
MQKFSRASNALLLICSVSCCSSVFAAGFYNDLQSVSAMGNAFAGAGAAGDDASISFYNPAGLMLLKEGQLVLSGIYADLNSDLTVDYVADSLGNPKSGAGEQYSALPNQLSPALYAAAPLGDSFVLGMSVTSPYEITSDYTDAVIDNTARQTQFIAYTGNLSLAMALTKQLSLGIGGNLQYFKAKMNADIGAPLPGSSPTVTLSGFTEYTGDDIAFYPNFGLLYEFNEDIRLGLNYRMHVDQETHGNLLTDITLQEGSTSISEDSSIPGTSLFLFPDIFSINLFYQPVKKVELLADVMFTRWSRFQAVTVNTEQKFGNSTQPVDTTLDFRDTWRVGVGVNYYFTPAIKLRTGLAYDQSPVTDETRTFQGPDSNRVDAAVGLMYKPKIWKKTYFDVAYMHTFFQDGTASELNPVARIIPPTLNYPNIGGISATGSFKTSADFFGLQLVHLM